MISDDNNTCIGDYEIIDLQVVIYTNKYILQPDNDLVSELSLTTSNEGSSFLNDLISDGNLYSQYLNGTINFDDLMREMHRANSVTTTDFSNKEFFESGDHDDFDYTKSAKQLKKNKKENEAKSSYLKNTGPRKKYIPAGSRLPIELAQYLGEAERYLNNDETEKAEEICIEVHKTASRASQPLVILAEIYYRRGDLEKAKKFLFEAAQKNPSDTSTWLTLIDLAEENDDLPLAIYYARNALKSAKHDTSLRQRLIEFYQKAGRVREPLQLRLSALSISPESSGELQFSVARELADEFFKLMDPTSSIKAYEIAFSKYPTYGTDNDRNTALSMMLQLKKYDQALKFFTNFCGVRFYLQNGDFFDLKKQSLDKIKSFDQFDRCEYPEHLIPALYLKLFLIIVRLGLGSLILNKFESCLTDDIIEKYSNWCLDIVKAYKDKGIHNTVIKLLLILCQSRHTAKLKQIWILLAESYLEIGKVDDSVECYHHVINELDPRDPTARLSLVNLLRRLGQHDEALKILNPSNLKRKTSKLSKKASVTELVKTESGDRSIVEDEDDNGAVGDVDDMEVSAAAADSDDSEYVPDDEDEDVSDDVDGKDRFEYSQIKAGSSTDKPLWLLGVSDLASSDPIAFRLAFERCRMLDASETVDLFLQETWAFFFDVITRVCGLDFDQIAVLVDSDVRRKVIIDRVASVTPVLTDDSTSTGRSSTRETCQLKSFDLWGLFLRLINLLLTRLPTSLAQLETAAVWGSLLPYVHNNNMRRLATSHLLISASLLARHGSLAFCELRNIQKKWMDKNQFWNVLNLAITWSKDFKHSRYLDRLLNKIGLTLPAGTIASSDLLIRGSFRYAIARLISIREKYPNNPLISLLLVVGFLSISIQRHVSSRHLPILQALGFLAEYVRLRGSCQEVYYNIARTCHQLCLNHISIHYYNKVLETEPIGDTNFEREIVDLRKEAAFNLMLIYRSNGNFFMARYVLQKYLVI